MTWKRRGGRGIDLATEVQTRGSHLRMYVLAVLAFLLLLSFDYPSHDPPLVLLTVRPPVFPLVYNNCTGGFDRKRACESVVCQTDCSGPQASSTDTSAILLYE